MVTQGAIMLELMRAKTGRKNRAVECDVDGSDIGEVISKLLARECSVQCSMAAIRDRLVRKMLQEDPANVGRVPWSVTDEATYDDVCRALRSAGAAGRSRD